MNSEADHNIHTTLQSKIYYPRINIEKNFADQDNRQSIQMICETYASGSALSLVNKDSICFLTY